MKILFLLFLFVNLILSIGIQSAWAPSNELVFVGNSHFENTPVIHPGETAKFTIKLWLDGPFEIFDVKPVIDISPASANSHIKIETETLNYLDPRTAGTFHVTITADSKIPLGKIFLSSYFVAKDNYGREVKGGWSNPDSWIDVEQAKFVSNIDDSLISPLHQFKSGVSAEKVKCKQDLLLIIKSRDGSPACMKPTSVLHLMDAGWGYIPKAFETQADLLNSTITGGRIVEFKFDLAAPSIVINLETTSDGSLQLTIPKSLTGSMSWYENNPSHGFLVDGKILELDETITAEGATSIIPFKKGAKVIEIFGSHEHTSVNCPEDQSLDLPPVKIDQFGNGLRLVFFVKSNSTAQICIRYDSNLDNKGNFPVEGQLISDYFDNQKSHVSSNVTISTQPSSVPLEIGSETLVLYTITAPNNSGGVYWLPQSQMCDAIPIVVWSDLPQVDSSNLPVLVGSHSCPAQMLDAQIVGFSGALMDYKPAKPIGNRN